MEFCFQIQNNLNNVFHFVVRFNLKQTYKCYLQVTLLRLENRYAPKLEYLTQADIEFILSCSQTKRQKYYSYLYKTENTDSTVQVCNTAILFHCQKNTDFDRLFFR